MLLLQRTCTRRRLPVAPIRCIHHDSAKQEPIKLHRMVNVYMYNKLSAIEEIKDNLLLTWHKQLGVTGRVYLHPEGINAQLAVPEARVKAFMRKVSSIHCWSSFCKSWVLTFCLGEILSYFQEG